MNKVQTGLEQLKNSIDFQKLCTGDIGLLFHNASVDQNFQSTATLCKQLFGTNLKKLFGPQHGIVSDVQDNMVESDHFIHPHYQIPVYSLYSETRKPTRQMLEGLDSLIIDLQDVGTRVYTYISTVQLLLEAISEYKLETKVIMLDRPNPARGDLIEGNILEREFSSFVGMLPIPMRHGMTLGEVARFIINEKKLDIELTIVPMQRWHREMTYNDTGLSWVNPSPNLSTAESAITFCGTVLFEGTNISEGRGTTRALELIGHPDIKNPFELKEEFTKFLADCHLYGYELRPIFFEPTFQKHHKEQCGGFQLHITDSSLFHSWKLGQLLCHFLYHHSQIDFQWNTKPYEYEFDRLAIDLINGTDKIRKWIENRGNLEELQEIEMSERETFLHKRENVLLYN